MMNPFYLSVLIGCAWSAPPDPDAEFLFTAELAPPINSSQPAESPSGFSRWWRLGSLKRWLGNHPDARQNLPSLDDYLRAHPDAQTEAAWEIVQHDLQPKPTATLTVSATPFRVVVTVDRSYSTAPDRKAAIEGVNEELGRSGIPHLEVQDRGTSTVSIQRGGAVVATVNLSDAPEPTGWLVLQEGKAVQWIPHDIASTAITDINAYFEAP